MDKFRKEGNSTKNLMENVEATDIVEATEFFPEKEFDEDFKLTGLARVAYGCYYKRNMDRSELSEYIANTVKDELEKFIKNFSNETLDIVFEDKLRKFLAKFDMQLAENHDYSLQWADKNEDQELVF